MDALIDLVAGLVHWRVALSVVGSASIAWLMSVTMSWFSAGYALTLVILSTAFGIYWQGRHEAGLGLLEKSPPSTVSPLVSFLGIAVIGFFWGGITAYFLQSDYLAALALFVTGLFSCTVYGSLMQQAFSFARLAFVTIALEVGFGLPFAIKVLGG